MRYADVKTALVELFDPDKLKAVPHEWGFRCEREIEIDRIAVAVNLTPATVLGAHRAGARLLITHHDAWNFVYGLSEACEARLRQFGIVHTFFHTPLDDADFFGTAVALAFHLGLQDCERAIPIGDGLFAGRVGRLPEPVDVSVFTEQLYAQTGPPVYYYPNSGKPVSKVCIATGAGHMTDSLQAALAMGCDCYITGEYSLYTQLYAELVGLNLIVGTHTGTERAGIQALGVFLSKKTGLPLTLIDEPNQ